MPTQPTGVSFTANLPLAWLEANVNTVELAHYRQHANVVLLHALATLEALPVDLEKELGPAAKAYERLEAKVDVMLEMMAHLLAERGQLPAPHSLTLWPDRIEWLDQQPPSAGSSILISLYLSPKLPQPLQLLASVESSQAGQAQNSVLATFQGLNEELTEWLERTVFRYHRRALQQHSR